MTPGLLPGSELAPAQTATAAAPKAMVVTVPQLRLLQPLVWRCASLLHMVRGSLRLSPTILSAVGRRREVVRTRTLKPVARLLLVCCE